MAEYVPLRATCGVDELRGWDLAAPPIVADAGYGEISAFRAALEERELTYVVEVKATTSAYAPEVVADRLPARGWGRPSAARYRGRPVRSAPWPGRPALRGRARSPGVRAPEV
jgi:SRSO17 transposase